MCSVKAGVDALVAYVDLLLHFSSKGSRYDEVITPLKDSVLDSELVSVSKIGS